MSRMVMIRCALDALRSSGSFGVHGIIAGRILPDLGLGKGRKSWKIAEISTPLTPLKMTHFSLFQENKAPTREICT